MVQIERLRQMSPSIHRPRTPLDRMNQLHKLLLLSALLGLICGCAHMPKVSSAERASIYARADVHFAQTVLIKPEDSELPEFVMAPLLVQEVTSTNAIPPLPYALYFWSTVGLLANQPVQQLNYLWFYPTGGKPRRTPQGVRITLGSDGQPMLWEILQDQSGVRILYVSQALEAAAMTNDPSPLPGRRYWVERSVEETPNIIVARIIDDSATAMGPILYLSAGSHDVSTLICRCMDAQAEAVVGDGIYRIARLDDAAVRWLSQTKTRGITRWLPGAPADNFDQWLRLSTN